MPFSVVQRIWRKHGLQPHRLEPHLVSNDPDFETTAADVIGLYLNPPVHAAVFCVDEKTAIQALDRKNRLLPRAPRARRGPRVEYRRNGTLSLFAALNTATGEVLGMTAPRHISELFVGFLGDVVASQPEGREIHVICDNAGGVPGRGGSGVGAGFVLSEVTLGGWIFDQKCSNSGMHLASLAFSLGAASIALAFPCRSTAHARATPLVRA